MQKRGTALLWLAALCVGVVVCSCAAPRVSSMSATRSNVNETLEITLGPKRVTALIHALQGDASVNEAGVAVQISPWIPPRATMSVNATAYVSALEDAQTKAVAIARRLAVPLGRVTAVEEVLGDLSAGSASTGAKLQGLALRAQPPTVSAAPGGLVTVAVSFAGPVPISVFGMSQPMPQVPNLGEAAGVEVSMQSRGTDFPSASRQLQRVENAVRAIAQRVGGASTRITIRSSSANSY